MIRFFATLFLCIFALSACSKSIDNSKLRVDVIDDAPRAFSVTAIPMRESSAYLRAATAQGLVTFDQQGRIVPAMAARWIVTDDELSYIFRLNKIRWNDGRDITSEDIAEILNARIKELRGGRFGSELDLIDKVVSMTGKVIEIRLKAPVPNLLELIAQPEFGLIRKGAGSGPILAQKFDGYMQLRLKGVNEKNETILKDDLITLRVARASLALARFRAGSSDLVTGGRFQHLPVLEATNATDGIIQFDPAPGLFGLLIIEAGPFLSQAPNREAIAMAIDRPKLLTSFKLPGWQETFTIVPETMQNRADVARPQWAAMRMDERLVQARDRISAWQSTNGKVRPLRIAMPVGAGARIFFAQIKGDMAAIGLRAERVTLNQPADIVLIDRVADMSSPAWYLSQLSCTVSFVCDAAADSLVAQARMAPNKDERTRLLGEAELRLQAKRNFIPIANPLRWSLTRNGLLGFTPNARSWHLLQYLGRDPT